MSKNKSDKTPKKNKKVVMISEKKLKKLLKSLPQLFEHVKSIDKNVETQIKNYVGKNVPSLQRFAQLERVVQMLSVRVENLYREFHFRNEKAGHAVEGSCQTLSQLVEQLKKIDQETSPQYKPKLCGISIAAEPTGRIILHRDPWSRNTVKEIIAIFEQWSNVDTTLVGRPVRQLFTESAVDMVLGGGLTTLQHVQQFLDGWVVETIQKDHIGGKTEPDSTGPTPSTEKSDQKEKPLTLLALTSTLYMFENRQRSFKNFDFEFQWVDKDKIKLVFKAVSTDELTSEMLAIKLNLGFRDLISKTSSDDYSNDPYVYLQEKKLTRTGSENLIALTTIDQFRHYSDKAIEAYLETHHSKEQPGKPVQENKDPTVTLLAFINILRGLFFMNMKFKDFDFDVQWDEQQSIRLVFKTPLDTEISGEKLGMKIHEAFHNLLPVTVINTQSVDPYVYLQAGELSPIIPINSMGQFVLWTHHAILAYRQQHPATLSHPE